MTEEEWWATRRVAWSVELWSSMVFYLQHPLSDGTCTLPIRTFFRGVLNAPSVEACPFVDIKKSREHRLGSIVIIDKVGLLEWLRAHLDKPEMLDAVLLELEET